MRTKAITVNGTPGYFQLGDSSCLITTPPYPINDQFEHVDITGFKIAAKDGLAWNSSDAEPDASATRGEFRSQDARSNGVWYTDRWDLTRTPDSHPLYGGEDPRLKQTEGQWMNGRKSRPVAFVRLLGDRESILINPYSSNNAQNSLEKVYPFKYGTRRYCTQIRFHDTGLMDFIYWVDGVQIIQLDNYRIDDSGNIGDLHCKIGVYLRKRDLGLVTSAPDLWVHVTNFVSHTGEATPTDIGMDKPPADQVVSDQSDDKFDQLAKAVRQVKTYSNKQDDAERIAKSLDKLAKRIRDYELKLAKSNKT